MNGLRYFILFGILSTQISDAGIVRRFRRSRRDGSDSASNGIDSNEHVITKPLNPATVQPPVAMATEPPASMTTKPPTHACDITQRYAEQRGFFMKINDPHICDNFLAQRSRVKIEFLPKVEGCLKALKWLQDTFNTSSTFEGSTKHVYEKIVCRGPEEANCNDEDNDSKKICGKMGDEYRFFRSKCHQCAHSCREVVEGGEYYKTIKNKTRCKDEAKRKTTIHNATTAPVGATDESTNPPVGTTLRMTTPIATTHELMTTLRRASLEETAVHVGTTLRSTTPLSTFLDLASTSIGTTLAITPPHLGTTFEMTTSIESTLEATTSSKGRTSESIPPSTGPTVEVTTFKIAKTLESTPPPIGTTTPPVVPTLVEELKTKAKCTVAAPTPSCLNWTFVCPDIELLVLGRELGPVPVLPRWKEAGTNHNV